LVAAVELVGGVLFLRGLTGSARDGGHERAQFEKSGRFSRQQIRAGRRAIDHDEPASLDKDMREVALGWARFLTRSDLMDASRSFRSFWSPSLFWAPKTSPAERGDAH
jgi:hypothetical protein